MYESFTTTRSSGPGRGHWLICEIIHKGPKQKTRFTAEFRLVMVISQRREKTTVIPGLLGSGRRQFDCWRQRPPDYALGAVFFSFARIRAKVGPTLLTGIPVSWLRSAYDLCSR